MIIIAMDHVCSVIRSGRTHHRIYVPAESTVPNHRCANILMRARARCLCRPQRCLLRREPHLWRTNIHCRPLYRPLRREPQVWRAINFGRPLYRLGCIESEVPSRPDEQVLDRESAKSFSYNGTNSEEEEPT